MSISHQRIRAESLVLRAFCFVETKNCLGFGLNSLINRDYGIHIMASRMNPFIFLQQVRQETAKVTWPTRRETTISVIMVLVFAVIASIFFLAADQLIAWLVSLILNIGG